MPKAEHNIATVYEALPHIETFLKANGWTVHQKDYTTSAINQWLSFSKNDSKFILRASGMSYIAYAQNSLLHNGRRGNWYTKTDLPNLYAYAFDSVPSPLPSDVYGYTGRSPEATFTGYFPKTNSAIKLILLTYGDSLHVIFRMEDINYLQLHLGNVNKSVAYSGGRVMFSNYCHPIYAITDASPQAYPYGSPPWIKYSGGATIYESYGSKPLLDGFINEGSSVDFSDLEQYPRNQFEITKNPYYDETNNTGNKWTGQSTTGKTRDTSTVGNNWRNYLYYSATGRGKGVSDFIKDSRAPLEVINRGIGSRSYTGVNPLDPTTNVMGLRFDYNKGLPKTQAVFTTNFAYWGNAFAPGINQDWAYAPALNPTATLPVVRYVGTEGRKLLLPILLFRLGRNVKIAETEVKRANAGTFHNITNPENQYYAGEVNHLRMVNPSGLKAESTLEFGAEKWFVLPDFNANDSRSYPVASRASRRISDTQPWIAVRYE